MHAPQTTSATPLVTAKKANKVKPIYHYERTILLRFCIDADLDEYEHIPTDPLKNLLVSPWHAYSAGQHAGYDFPFEHINMDLIWQKLLPMVPTHNSIASLKENRWLRFGYYDASDSDRPQKAMQIQTAEEVAGLVQNFPLLSPESPNGYIVLEYIDDQPDEPLEPVPGT